MLDNLFTLKNARSRSVSAENFTAEKGCGGMATEGTGAQCARELGRGWKISPSIEIDAGSVFTLANIHDMGIINHIWITYCSDPGFARHLILRIYWDDADIPSVECPLGDFFACAGEHLGDIPFSSAAVCVNPRMAFNCYWQMPFRSGFKVTLENRSPQSVTIFYQIDYTQTEVDANAGYFHAQFRRVNPLPYKQDYTILDNISGKGHYIGTYLFWGVHNRGWWGEGEIKFFIDGDTEFPTICGTGTEDYFCGSHDFDIGGEYREFCTMYAGLSRVIRPDGTYNSQQNFSMYRWHIYDPIYFDTDLRITIQALGWRSEGRYLPLQDDISSVAYWYQDSICTTFPELPDDNFLEII